MEIFLWWLLYRYNSNILSAHWCLLTIFNSVKDLNSWYNGCFSLKSVHFLLQSWILIKPSVLIGFLWHCSARDNGVEPYNHQWKEKSTFPTRPPFTLDKGGSLFQLSRSESSAFLLLSVSTDISLTERNRISLSLFPLEPLVVLLWVGIEWLYHY